MSQRIAPWAFYCSPCDYWSANLAYDIQSTSDEIFSGGDEEAISFLDSLRIRNFNILLDKAEATLGATKLSILDVGCATGLFVAVATARGHSVLGLEPNPRMAASAKEKGLNVIEGYFPDALPSDIAFDLITFNDVFEHIPHLSGIMDGIKSRLKPNGLLVLNLPNSKGLLFRMGQIAYKLGVTNLWHRLWQTMFYTPHLHYFNSKSLDAFVSRFGMKACSSSIELPTMSISGLWGRVSADKKTSFPKKVFTYSSALAVYPVLQFFPQDTFAAFYKKSDQPGA